MGFSTRRGRPPKVAMEGNDLGTAELRLKHALGLTTEPIDLCLQRQLITQSQHWCGLHLRWLYTVRYGAPVITAHYANRDDSGPRGEDDPVWRREREQEYREAIAVLHATRHYEPVMRVCVYNESPAFLNEGLRQRAWEKPALAEQLSATHQRFREGLESLALHWKRR